MKNAFLVGIILIFLLLAAGAAWLVIQYQRAECLRPIMQRNRFLGILCALLPLLVLCIFFRYNATTVLIVGIHLFIITLATKLLCFALGKLFRFSLRNDLVLGIGFVLTAIVLICGFINMHTVRKTEYTVLTDKQLPEGGIRIAMISDVHLSTCMDGDRFETLVNEIAANDPDILLICGDLVDESSTMDDLEKVCSALKSIQPAYGIRFVFGNHDTGIYGKREIAKSALESALENANVTLLEDTTILFGTFTLTGRTDASIRERKSAAELKEGLSDETFSILMDHQPTDYENEAAAGFDLVLSGHTHGGQMFPAGQFGMLLGANDLLYGSEVRDGTTFIVSSGVSGWAIPFKTGTVSEYLVIDIRQK